MFVIALTGGIASGKSVVSRLLEEKGALLLDSDQLAREVVREGMPAWRDIVDHFGEGVLQPDGEIDRQALADIVFQDHSERSFLNSVTHPRIFQIMLDRLKEEEAREGGARIAVLDIPLLIEAGAGGMFDFTLVVDASPETQLKRLMSDRDSSEEEGLARIASQVSREGRLAHADYVIHNEGDFEDLRREVDKAWEFISARADDDPGS